MENNPKKSKALIITFIIVLLLLIGGYLLYQNSAKIFGTKGATTINKIFSPLLGTSKNTALDTIDNSSSSTSDNTTGTNTTGSSTTNSDTSGNTNNTDTLSGNNFNQSGSNSDSGSFTNGNNLDLNAGLNSIPIPSYTDNQNYPSTSINSTSDTTNNSSTDTTTLSNLDSGTETDASVCAGQAKLVFTDAETTQINKLLDRYYTIADTLQTEQSLATVNTDIGNKQAMVDQAKNLTNLCYEEKSDPDYTGTKRVTNNPYYQNPSSTNSYYFNKGIEDAFSIW